MDWVPKLGATLKVVFWIAAGCVVERNFDISTAVTTYFPQIRYVADQPVPIVVPVSLRDPSDLFPTALRHSQELDIYGLNLTNASEIIAPETVNILGVNYEVRLTANASDILQFASNISSAKSESMHHTCLLACSRWSWLYDLTGYNPFDNVLRAIVMFLLCHDYVMSRIYVAFPTMTLVGGAMFYGWQFRVKSLRKIVILSKKLSSAENTAVLARNVAQQLQSQCDELLRLKGISENEAETARRDARDAIDARERVEKTLEKANSAAKTAKEEVEEVKTKAANAAREANLRIDDFEHSIAREDRTISQLRSNISNLETDLKQSRMDAIAAAEKAESTSQRDAALLREQIRKKDDLLKTQGQNTIALQKKVMALKDSKPEALEELKRQIEVKQQLRKEAEEKLVRSEAEMARKAEAENQRANTAIRDLKAAEEKCASLEAEMAQRVDAAANEVKSMEAKLHATTKLLGELKVEMEEMDLNFRGIIAHLEEVHISKDNTIRVLEARIRDLASSSKDESVRTSSQEPDEPSHPPAATPSAEESVSIAADDATTDDQGPEMSIEGAARSRNITGSEDSRAENDGSNTGSTSTGQPNQAARTPICEKCRNRHGGRCTARPRPKNSEAGSARPRCPHCEKIHKGVCRLAPGNVDKPTSSSASNAADSFRRQQEGWFK